MEYNEINRRNPSYQMKRALRTVAADDSDYIPKVLNAGCIIDDGIDVPYQIMHNGVKVVKDCYYNETWTTDVIYGLKGHHEPQEEKCFYEVLKWMPENAVMIELGAYWAYYSLWFASSVKNPINYLIEPDPIRLETGRRNFDLNGKNGYFFRGFVGVLRDPEPDANGVQYISIDKFIEDNHLDRVHIIHADIQGAEHEMLLSAINSLSKIDYFFISTHDPVRDHQQSLMFLQDHGFIIIAEHSPYESCSFDGLIVARNRNCKGLDSIEIRKY